VSEGGLGAPWARGESRAAIPRSGASRAAGCPHGPPAVEIVMAAPPVEVHRRNPQGGVVCW